MQPHILDSGAHPRIQNVNRQNYILHQNALSRPEHCAPLAEHYSSRAWVDRPIHSAQDNATPEGSNAYNINLLQAEQGHHMCTAPNSFIRSGFLSASVCFVGAKSSTDHFDTCQAVYKDRYKEARDIPHYHHIFPGKAHLLRGIGLYCSMLKLKPKLLNAHLCS